MHILYVKHTHTCVHAHFYDIHIRICSYVHIFPVSDFHFHFGQFGFLNIAFLDIIRFDYNKNTSTSVKKNFHPHPSKLSQI